MTSLAIRRRTLGILTVMLALLACRDLEVEGYKCSDFVRAGVYYGRSHEERLAEIRTYPLEKQYAVFICGMRFMRPAQLEVARPLEEQGKTTADFLKAKLQSAQDAPTIMYIARLVYWMDAAGKYAATEDPDLVQALGSAVSRMPDGHWKQRSEEYLEQIRTPTQ